MSELYRGTKYADISFKNRLVVMGNSYCDDRFTAAVFMDDVY